MNTLRVISYILAGKMWQNKMHLNAFFFLFLRLFRLVLYSSVARVKNLTQKKTEIPREGSNRDEILCTVQSAPWTILYSAICLLDCTVQSAPLTVQYNLLLRRYSTICSLDNPIQCNLHLRLYSTICPLDDSVNF